MTAPKATTPSEPQRPGNPAPGADMDKGAPPRRDESRRPRGKDDQPAEKGPGSASADVGMTADGDANPGGPSDGSA